MSTLFVFAFVLCFLFGLLFSIGSLEPNEYGIMKNSMTGQVSEEWYKGGLHFIGPVTEFLTFPSTQETIELSRTSSQGFPVQTRTGADPNDPDSGGQPITISCSYQYIIDPNRLRQVYLSFGSFFAAHARWVLLSSNSVSNQAQKFTPQDFWQRREVVAESMLMEMNKTLWEQGYISVVRFQFLRIDFAPKFEDSITANQVAEQQRVVNEYTQKVTAVEQRIQVLRSENLATIANISAAAEARGRTMMARARKDMFHLKQQMKAQKYKELREMMNFTEYDMSQYFKIKALQAQTSKGKVSVGMKTVGTRAPKTSLPAMKGRLAMEL
jgi:regulator of protease activity HflC (stomatin/prohibitin superfamily)